MTGRVTITPAGAARWPELGVEAGDTGRLTSFHGDDARVRLDGWPEWPDLLLADGDYTTDGTETTPCAPSSGSSPTNAANSGHGNHTRGTGVQPCAAPNGSRQVGHAGRLLAVLHAADLRRSAP